jgi:hypothetical protein
MSKSGRSNKEQKIKNYGRTKNEKEDDEKFSNLSRLLVQSPDIDLDDDLEDEEEDSPKLRW